MVRVQVAEEITELLSHLRGDLRVKFAFGGEYIYYSQGASLIFTK